mmetsp:Transcript_116294/g.329554  ORF Transcript_116294/g.329554 Transcript_116294/m.329554 type:complete len:521 (+) Transcript_116294:173-1735(+)
MRHRSRGGLLAARSGPCPTSLVYDGLVNRRLHALKINRVTHPPQVDDFALVHGMPIDDDLKHRARPQARDGPVCAVGSFRRSPGSTSNGGARSAITFLREECELRVLVDHDLDELLQVRPDRDLEREDPGPLLVGRHLLVAPVVEGAADGVRVARRPLDALVRDGPGRLLGDRGHDDVGVDYLESDLHHLAGLPGEPPGLVVAHVVGAPDGTGLTSLVLRRVDHLVHVAVAHEAEPLVLGDADPHARLPHVLLVLHLGHVLHVQALPGGPGAHDAVGVRPARRAGPPRGLARLLHVPEAPRLHEVLVRLRGLLRRGLHPPHHRGHRAPAQRDAVLRAGRHFLVPAVDEPVQAVALEIRTDDPRHHGAALGDGEDRRVGVLVQPELELLPPGLPEGDEARPRALALLFYGPRLAEAVPRADNVHVLDGRLVHPGVLGLELVLAGVAVAADVVRRELVADGVGVVAPPLVCDRRGQGDRLPVHVVHRPLVYRAGQSDVIDLLKVQHPRLARPPLRGREHVRA